MTNRPATQPVELSYQAPAARRPMGWKSVVGAVLTALVGLPVLFYLGMFLIYGGVGVFGESLTAAVTGSIITGVVVVGGLAWGSVAAWRSERWRWLALGIWIGPGLGALAILAMALFTK
ncbi:MAG TPA: hypothetical protein VEA69_25830 [Tepidisphaeraceae bacterium]|nr:hypothetical protein [Tepidisphaeraceae bacterium]